MKTLRIGDRLVGPEHKPFIIAEMSGNHSQSLDKALEMVEAAAKAGVDAVKLQTYTADTMTLNIRDRDDFYLTENSKLWNGKHLYDLYEKSFTPWDWHQTIMDRAKQLGVLCFSSPFDPTAVDFLEKLDVPCYKIASCENTDVGLIRKVARLGKPVIASIGTATLGDIHLLTSTLEANGCSRDNFVILKCTSSYPASPRDANIATIPHMRDLLHCQVGLSDHTSGVGVAVAAVALGATVVEKHFCMARSEGGVDAAFSLEPPELKALVEETNRAWESIGTVQYNPMKSEKECVRSKRSLYITQNIEEGTVLTPENVRAVRPGFGLAPRFADIVMGKKVNKSVKAGTPLSWDLIG